MRRIAASALALAGLAAGTNPRETEVETCDGLGEEACGKSYLATGPACAWVKDCKEDTSSCKDECAGSYGVCEFGHWNTKLEDCSKAEHCYLDLNTRVRGWFPDLGKQLSSKLFDKYYNWNDHVEAEFATCEKRVNGKAPPGQMCMCITSEYGVDGFGWWDNTKNNGKGSCNCGSDNMALDETVYLSKGCPNSVDYMERYVVAEDQCMDTSPLEGDPTSMRGYCLTSNRMFFATYAKTNSCSIKDDVNASEDVVLPNGTSGFICYPKGEKQSATVAFKGCGQHTPTPTIAAYDRVDSCVGLSESDCPNSGLKTGGHCVWYTACGASEAACGDECGSYQECNSGDDFDTDISTCMNSGSCYVEINPEAPADTADMGEYFKDIFFDDYYVYRKFINKDYATCVPKVDGTRPGGALCLAYSSQYGVQGLGVWDPADGGNCISQHLLAVDFAYHSDKECKTSASSKARKIVRQDYCVDTTPPGGAAASEFAVCKASDKLFYQTFTGSSECEGETPTVVMPDLAPGACRPHAGKFATVSYDGCDDTLPSMAPTEGGSDSEESAAGGVTAAAATLLTAVFVLVQ